MVMGRDSLGRSYSQGVTAFFYFLDTVVPSDATLTMNECTKMNKLAETDEGMKDLMQKAKEYLILKRK